MIGELVSSCLILVLGYAYPAFQCFKAVEKNRIEIPELRFWCQYWIIVAIITILERIGDVFISWVPMYEEIKLALFIYLWYPKSKGTRNIYNRFLRPYMSRHETDIDRSLMEFRTRAWNLAVYYWQNCTELGSTKILQFLEFVSSQAARSTRHKPQNVPNQRQYTAPQPSAPAQPSAPPLELMQGDKQPSSGPYASYRNEPFVSNSVRVELQNQMPFDRHENVRFSDSGVGGGLRGESSLDKDVTTTRHRLRRFIDGE